MEPKLTTAPGPRHGACFRSCPPGLGLVCASKCVRVCRNSILTRDGGRRRCRAPPDDAGVLGTGTTPASASLSSSATVAALAAQLQRLLQQPRTCRSRTLGQQGPPCGLLLQLERAAAAAEQVRSAHPATDISKGARSFLCGRLRAPSWPL